jgi:hypothetical protein
MRRYHVIARKDGEQVHLWARPTSDYSKYFRRIRDAVAALTVNSAVLDDEAIVLRPNNSFDFEALRSRQGREEAILVAYDIMEVDGQGVRPEPLEERRKRLAKLLSRKTKVMRDGVQLSEAITGDGAAIFRYACGMGLSSRPFSSTDVTKLAIWSALCQIFSTREHRDMTGNATARVHHASRWSWGQLVVFSAGAAIGDAGDRLPSLFVRRRAVGPA